MPALYAVKWKKGRPDDPLGLQKGAPQLHPLLQLSGTDIALNLRFIDITELYFALHGMSPWWRTLRYLQLTHPAVRILASLEGHPMVWYVVVPESVAALGGLETAVMLMPADYGAISYEYSIRGITSPLHGESLSNLQSGLEILARVLLEPLSDDRYDALLAGYIALRKTFKGATDSLPPPLHHFRSILSYVAEGGNLRPLYWDVPFGWERALYEQKYILMLPLMNGGQGGVLLKSGLAGLLRNGVHAIYTQSDVLVHETIDVANPVLMAYSQSGGNLFTAAAASADQVRALVLFEPQYMNKHYGSEDRNLRLGKDVVPALLRQGVKVISVGRRKDGWATKYLPAGSATGIEVLPDDANYGLMRYPLEGQPSLSATHDIIKHRYSRLVNGSSDHSIDVILGSDDPARLDMPTTNEELKVEDFILRQRKSGVTDGQLVLAVFSPQYNVDDSGGYFTHNFVIAGGQKFDLQLRRYDTFLHEALRSVG